MRLFNITETAFDNFDNTIKTYLSKALNAEQIDYSKSQIFNVILTAIKGVVQNAMFYIEDAFTEQNIDTAIRKKSVYSLAKLSGFEPSYGSAAVGNVILKYSQGQSLSNITSKIYIPNGTLLVNDTTGLKYTIYLPTDYYIIDLANPLVSHNLKVVQGVWTTSRYMGLGNPLEAIHISSSAPFDKEYVEVYVNNIKYTQVASLYDMYENSEEYMVSVGYDNTFDIIFGNGVHGKMLSEGDSVTIRYIIHLGSSGNVATTDNPKFSFNSVCYDSFGNTVNANQYIDITINDSITGGTDEDSIDTVKRMVGYSSRSLVLANEDNFRLFLRRFSFIGKTNIISEPNSLTVTLHCMSNYKNSIKDYDDYLKLNTKDMLLTNREKELVIDTFNNSKKAFAGLNIIMNDPVIRRYAAICYIKVNSIYDKETAKEGVKSSICDYFINLEDNVKFIPKSDLIKKVLDENPVIKSFDIHFISDANEKAYKNRYYNKYVLKYINGVYKYVPIKYIYESTNQVGLDAYGNISVESDIEVPVLNGGFKYYPDKSEVYKAGETEDINIDAIQYFFI